MIRVKIHEKKLKKDNEKNDKSSSLIRSGVITPKFDAELTWEGIECSSWGVTKGVYRRRPLRAKRGKESFKTLVDECTSGEILLSKTVHNFSSRKRAYICAYY
jgi:hypothetical protein